MSMENLGPYTNFHELNQDWFLQEFNKIIEQWKTMQKNFNNLHDAFNDLKSYVQNYFKNLDVQEEIDNKLNNMAKSGELSNLIMPFITENANPIFVVSESDMKDKTKTYVLTTNGHIFTYIKNSFVDSGLVYGITNLSMLGFGSLFYSNESVPAGYNNFNNLPNNKILWYSGITGLVNAPKENFSGCVITYSYVSDGGAKVQVCYEQETNNTFTRVFSADKWSMWVTTLTKKETNFYVNFPDKPNNFNSVTDCLYAVQATKGIKNVYINSGTYDILNELGGMTYINNIDTSKDWDEVQPVVNDCNIYGIGDVLLKMELETTTRDKYFLFSPLNVRGNIHIENINVKAKKCRYCIHDENGTNYPDSIKEYINVNCFHDNSEYGGQAVGCGYSKNTKAYFENCNFKCSGISEAFSVHESGDCILTFNSSYFYSTSTTGCVRISEVGLNYCTVKFINCILKDGLYLRDEIQPSTSNGNTKVDLINSYYLKVKSDYPTNLSEITQYNTLTGEVKTIETI